MTWPAVTPSLWFFFGFVLFVAVQRLLEVRLSSRNARALLARHGVEAGRAHLPVMFALHVLFLAAAPLEAWWFSRAFRPWLAIPALAVFAAAQALRYWAIRTLGERWTVRVIYVTGTLPVVKGPYAYVRHPNYVAVIAEIAAIPLVHSAFLTAIVFSAANGILLAQRIRVEERLLRRIGSYGSALDRTPRFLPRG